mgnify:CR=1 FL=1
MTQTEFEQMYYKMVKDRPINEPFWHLRDQFAMAALPSVIIECKRTTDNSIGFGKTYIPFSYKTIANYSYQLADCMLEARKAKDEI